MKPGTLAVFAALAMSGCSYLGPGSVAITRPEYNIAIQRTNEQELLLNLVRIRYRDSLQFMSVQQVVSGLEIKRSVNANARLVESSPDSFGIGIGELSFLEKPTILYAPVEGERFVRQLMTPMEPSMLLLLTYSGWSVERVFAMTLQEANGLKNAPSASGPTPLREPEYREFRAALKLLRALQLEGGVELGSVADGDTQALELRFPGASSMSSTGLEFKKLMGLEPDRDRFRVVAGIGRRDGATLAVALRPLIATMSYLSQGVEPPVADVSSGRVTQTIDAQGKPFDWQKMLDGLFRVRSSASRPENAAVAVRYRGSWFYVDDSDLEVKSTFTLLAQLYALQSGQRPAVGPALSFTVGQ